QTIQDGWQHEVPDNWLRHSDPWEVARPYARVAIKLKCSFILRDGALRAIAGRDSYLYGIPYDRPVVGYGGKTINTLRLWAAAAPDYFDFQEFSSGDFVGALAETLAAESLARVLYPDDSTSMGQALRFVQEYFLVACSLADLVRRFRHINDNWDAFPEKVAIHVTQNPARYVIKPSGEAQNVKRRLFVGEEDDGQDVIRMLEAYKKAFSDEIKVFQLQRAGDGGGGGRWRLL